MTQAQYAGEASVINGGGNTPCIGRNILLERLHPIIYFLLGKVINYLSLADHLMQFLPSYLISRNWVPNILTAEIIAISIWLLDEYTAPILICIMANNISFR